jgi:hypothetical protein
MAKNRTRQTMEKRRREQEKQRKRLLKQTQRLERNAAKRLSREQGDVIPEPVGIDPAREADVPQEMKP